MLRLVLPQAGAGGVVTARLPRAASYVAVAAAVIVVASVLLQFATPTGPTPQSIVDINDRLSSAAMANHDNLRPLDINVCDSNAIP